MTWVVSFRNRTALYSLKYFTLNSIYLEVSGEMEDTTKISGSLETEAPMNYEASNEQDDPPEKQAPIEVLTEIPVENEAMIDEIDLIENEGSIEVLTETPVENEAMIDEDDIIENEGSIEVQAVTQASIEEEHSNEKEASTEKEASIEEDALAEDEISVSDDVVDSMYDQAINTASVNATPSILEDIENHYVGIRHDRDLLQIQLQEAGDKIKELTQKVLQFQGSEIESANYKNELEIACRKIQSLHEDRKVMQELMDRMQADGDNLREELR